jgi:hypothetical protein
MANRDGDSPSLEASGTNAEAAWDVRRLGRYLSAYRWRLSVAEAARRAGVPPDRWQAIEKGNAAPSSVSPYTIAAMCVAIGADIATGLELAGHDPREYSYLLQHPPQQMRQRAALSPRIAIYRDIIEAAAVPVVDPRPAIASTYREVAAENRLLAERLMESPPDERTDYWHGYADALRAIAGEQSRMADPEEPGPPR